MGKGYILLLALHTLSMLWQGNCIPPRAQTEHTHGTSYDREPKKQCMNRVHKT